MEYQILESKPSKKRMKELWNKFLLKKYGSEENIPDKPSEEDWKEFIESVENTMKDSIANIVFKELSPKEKEKLKGEIKIKWVQEKEFLLGG